MFAKMALIQVNPFVHKFDGIRLYVVYERAYVHCSHTSNVALIGMERRSFFSLQLVITSEQCGYIETILKIGVCCKLFISKILSGKIVVHIRRYRLLIIFDMIFLKL